jgi:hypothetical protein
VPCSKQVLATARRAVVAVRKPACARFRAEIRRLITRVTNRRSTAVEDILHWPT